MKKLIKKHTVENKSTSQKIIVPKDAVYVNGYIIKATICTPKVKKV